MKKVILSSISLLVLCRFAMAGETLNTTNPSPLKEIKLMTQKVFIKSSDISACASMVPPAGAAAEATPAPPATPAAATKSVSDSKMNRAQK
jgi:hypothetical protein